MPDPSFLKLQRTIVEHTPSILAAIEHGLSNARNESVNTKVRLITRIAFGFKSPEPSSRWPCSTSADTDKPYLAANDPRKQQENQLFGIF